MKEVQTPPITTVTRLTIHSKGDNPVFGDTCVEIEIMDEGGGPFFSISQINERTGSEVHSIYLDTEFLPALHEAAKILLNEYYK